MIDQGLARECIALLSTAIGELMEDAHELAVIVTGPDAVAPIERARSLRQPGEDVVALAAAIEVLARGSGQRGDVL